MLQGIAMDMVLSDDVVLRLQGHIYVPNVDGARDVILEEEHRCGILFV